MSINISNEGQKCKTGHDERVIAGEGEQVKRVKEGGYG
jgi:hypothetical protein